MSYRSHGLSSSCHRLYIYIFKSSSYVDRHVIISYDIIHPEPRAGGNGKLELLTQIPFFFKKKSRITKLFLPIILYEMKITST